MDLHKEFLRFFKDNKMVKAADLVVVGVSGGVDSVVLTHALMPLRASLGIRLHLAHFNHQLRPSAIRDEVFVCKLAKSWGLPLTVGRRAHSKKGDFLSEDKSRELRYAFFNQVALKQKAKAVVLAHHQDDLVETVLMRLLRGAGLMGLQGIKPVALREDLLLLRPLMRVGRLDIERYAKKHRLAYCQDPTNQQAIYLRNKVRLELLPLLEKEYNSQVKQAILNLADIAQEDYACLYNMAAQRFEEIVVKNRNKVKILLTFLKKEPVSIRRLILRLMLEAKGVDPSAVPFTKIKELEKMIVFAKPLRIQILGDHQAILRNNYLEI